MTIFTAPITGVSPDPEVYGGLAAATNYARSEMFSPAADAWLALDANTKARTLRTATSYLERLVWDGARTGLAEGEPTTLAWPRTGIIIDGLPLDDTSVPADIVSAAFELAVGIAADPALTGKTDQGSLISSVSAGPASVSFAYPTSAASGTATRFPLVVQQLIGKYLAAPAGTNEGGTGTYGSACSAFARDRQYTLVGPE